MMRICTGCGATTRDDLLSCWACGAYFEEYDPATDDPPEFRYIGVAMGSHGGHAHVGPAITPDQLTALGHMMDRAYAQAVRELEDP